MRQRASLKDEGGGSVFKTRQVDIDTIDHVLVYAMDPALIWRRRKQDDYYRGGDVPEQLPASPSWRTWLTATLFRTCHHVAELDGEELH